MQNNSNNSKKNVTESSRISRKDIDENGKNSKRRAVYDVC